MNTQAIFIIISSIFLLLYSINNLGKTIEEENKHFIEQALNKFTRTTTSSFLSGIIVCLITQSSSVITILTISLISSKILTLKKGLAIVIGSNIGTTLVSLFITFDIGTFYFLFFIIGTILFFVNKKAISNIFIYMGLIFFSLDFLEEQLLILFNNSLLENMLLKFDNPILGIVSGTIISFLIQSSSTTIAITQKMYFNNLISNILGISIMLGANIGTTISGLIFSINQNIDAKRVAVGSLLFNFFGVLLSLPFLYIYKEYLTSYDEPYLISFMHISFNVVTGIIGFFLINSLTKLTSKLIKKK